MVPGGQTRTVTGAPPLELVLGNASAASVNFRGKPVDLAPYTRQKVARLVLQ
jgi:cytoskeleton protein RodZ